MSLGMDRIAVSICSLSMNSTLTCGVQPPSSFRNFQPAVAPNSPEVSMLVGMKWW